MDNSAASALSNAEKTAAEGGSLFTGNGLNPSEGGSGLLGKIGGNRAAPAITVVVLLLFLIPILIFAVPILMIGTIDYNLQKTLGFTGTIALVEQQGLSIVEELMKKAEISEGFAEDLANVGITIGQVTPSGDFARTNRYLANLDGGLEIAASGFDYYLNGGDGELAVLFDNQVINADNFVATVNSNPKLYAAYAKALDVSARFYYSSEVNQVYRDLGLSRGVFNDWKSSGDEVADTESFDEMLNVALKSDISVSMSGCDSAEGCSDVASLKSDSDRTSKIRDLLGGIQKKAKGTNNATQLLNSAISASEPIQASKAFLAIEEPLQRARANGDGPVNQLMNTLMMSGELTYTDVNTGEVKVAKQPILETTNFVAAVSDGTFSIAEANNFSRDRVLLATGTMNNNSIRETIVNDKGRSFSVVLPWGEGAPNSEILGKASGSVAMATLDFDKDTFTSIVGGNRAIEGGSYLSNTINMRVLGAMPSDAGTIMSYQREVSDALARKAEADRATLSPFDISSPNTFLGKIVHNMAEIMIRHTSSDGGSTLTTMVGTATDLATSSMNHLLGNVLADGEDQDFVTLSGDCTTVKMAGNVEGDIYCNSHNTITTKYIGRTKEEWEAALGGDISGGKIVDGSGLSNFIKFGTEREATVGVKSAAVCSAYNNGRTSVLSELVGVCMGVDDRIATGEAFTLSSSNSNLSNIEKYSGYVFYDEVYALIQESQSEVAAFKEEYYRNRPKDDSLSGFIARFSGMTKEEAEVAISYASYLNVIANYDARNRYVFSEPIIRTYGNEYFENVDEFTAIGAVLIDKISFADVRNRTFAV